ncbi:Glycine/D-amino acid oxidase [Pustulibacterium marinum]|uniref:Glycine/D-amino acid oxidase n=1 Tax=Pustulibacterium marinum TaxID=1224947 RepID=A0A1I7GRW4_9FLAO|nr:FAD-dependent oxidoreductase [Pustulibacterium marinum]SFU51174.1 Glycine/D-amino acid oxidase [Pustulibacterium marinum]
MSRFFIFVAMIDYVLVGSGLATISFAKELIEKDKSFVVIADESQQSSKVAGALFNPVILKRFTPVWKASEQLSAMLSTFRFYEEYFQDTFIESIPVLRKFASIEEQNLWFEATDNKLLSDYLSTKLISNSNPSLNVPHKYGEVLKTGKVDINKLITRFQDFLSGKDCFIKETFDHSELNNMDDGWKYKDLAFKNIVFCEGYGIHQNPFFNYLPLRGTKGELLVIKAPNLKLTEVVKSACFIIPLGDDLYKIGATYHHDTKNNEPSIEAKEELLEKLKGLLLCDFEIVDQLAGVRPTVADRRPLIGKHPKHDNMYILNGLGTRGVMIGPYIAKQLYDFIEDQIALDPVSDIKRFEKRWRKLNA